MARVYPLKETTIPLDPGNWTLWFQWCKYDLEDGVQYGYRFIWKRKDGSLQAARGQARLPTIREAQELMDKATAEGWGDRDGSLMEAAVARLTAHGCVAELGSGYVGWPNKLSSESGSLSQDLIDDARLLQSWS